MKLPLSWIKQFVDLTQSPAVIAKLLTMAGIEVDEYETTSANFDGIIVGTVTHAEQHPNADRLRVANVTDGRETYTVVCGAPNCRPGIKVAFAPIGATLKDEQGEFKIKKTKIRGVESSGMLCSGAELKLTTDADGIIELPEHLPNGMSVAELYADTIFTISLTPNLGHCTSVLGIARELSAVTGLPLREPKIDLSEDPAQMISKDVKVAVKDQSACPRYACRLIKNVKVGPSPEWLRRRLEQCDVRSVNNIVDVTNYVLLELGHPLHAFDFDCLAGHQVIVKKAEDGMVFKTLDGKDRVLNKETLLICDEKHPVAIAGIMGGLDSEVKEGTKNILLESAYFDPVCIRKASRQLGLQTDSSKRFERGTDPNRLILSLDHAAQLIQQVAGGEIVFGALDIKEKEFPEKLINCRLSRANQMLGTSLSAGEVEDVFQRLKFHYKWDGHDLFEVKVPTYRTDVTIEVDLIEEIARLYGYDNIPKRTCRYQSSEVLHHPVYLFEQQMHTRLIAEGLQEFLTCDLIGPTVLNIVGSKEVSSVEMIKVLNPTSIEQSVLRTSLLPGLLQVAKYNFDRQQNAISGYEIGRIHYKEGDQYKEQSVVGIILSGKSRPYHMDPKPQDYDFYDLKGIVENILGELGISQHEYKNLGLSTFHTGRQASVFIDSLEVGSIGEIHPSILRRLDMPQRLFFGEFNLHDLMKVVKRQVKMQELPLYPGSERDWTITVNEMIAFSELLSYIRLVTAPLLQNVILLDIYRSEKLGKEWKNVTIRFVYRDPLKTLEQEMVDNEHQHVTSEVVKRLGNHIRT